jgi:hypothetical protein
MKSGDKLTTDDGRTFELGDLVATRGRADCTSVQCTRRYAPGDPPGGVCFGYHCPKCGAATSMYGHRCPRDN